MAMDGQDERRKQKRIPFLKEIEVVGLGIYRASDISIGGMYLESMLDFPAGTLLDLRFKLSDSDEKPISLQARVLYSQPSVGLGLDFVNIIPEDRERISKFVEQR
jgi:c-di-GMP-binding flagellar brake protein YcgR